MTQSRRRLPRLTALNIVSLLEVIALILILLGELFQPVDPYHRAALATLQSALAELPLYPGSDTGKPQIKAGILDYQTTLLINYGTTAACTDVQAYYATTAAGAGWRVRYPVHIVRTGTPEHDELDSSYLKQEHGFDLELGLDCFADPTFQSGYTLLLQTPPDPA
jgi:hypothetical protein